MVLLSLSPEDALHKCPKGTAVCTARRRGKLTVDHKPSCPSRLKMHSTSDRRALRYARREGREGKLKTLSKLSYPSRLKMHSTSDRRALRYARREGWEVCYPPKKYRLFSIISTNQTPQTRISTPPGTAILEGRGADSKNLESVRVNNREVP